MVFRAVVLGKAASVPKILGSVVAVTLLGGLSLELLELGLRGLDLPVLLLVDFVDLLADHAAEDGAVGLAFAFNYFCHLCGGSAKLHREHGLGDAKLFAPRADRVLECDDGIEDAGLEPDLAVGIEC